MSRDLVENAVEVQDDFFGWTWQHLFVGVSLTTTAGLAHLAKVVSALGAGRRAAAFWNTAL